MNKVAHGQIGESHRFRVGELVGLAQGYGYAQRTGALYEIVALLPSDRGHVQYRIRSATEAFERVAAENQLISRGAPPAAAPAQPAPQRPSARIAVSAARRRGKR